MRPPAQIKDWLTIKKMFQWLHNAPDELSHKRRLAIWLTHTGKLNAHKVADILDVSTQAVWLWIGQYNAYGPVGLERKGRGGRRWGFMTLKQEAELLKPFIQRIRSGQSVKPLVIKGLVEQKLGRKVSKSYIYRMLSRHKWGQIVAQSRLATGTASDADSFRKFSRPWLRT